MIALRGGYGSAELLPLLHHLRPAQSPKLFIGYSDNTALLTWLTCVCGVPALHGPMLEGRLAKGADGYDERSFLSAIYGETGVALETARADRRCGRAKRRGCCSAARCRC